MKQWISNRYGVWTMAIRLHILHFLIEHYTPSFENKISKYKTIVNYKNTLNGNAIIISHTYETFYLNKDLNT